MIKPPTEPEPQPEIDFFQDMTPRVVPQQRVLISTGNESARVGQNFSRLQADSDIPVMNELKDWEELEQQQGWEEVDDESTKQLIREKKKELRHQRHHQHQPQRVHPYSY